MRLSTRASTELASFVDMTCILACASTVEPGFVDTRARYACLGGGNCVSLQAMVGSIHIMGIVNATPDSFFAGSRAAGEAAADRALALLVQGAVAQHPYLQWDADKVSGEDDGVGH